MDQQLYGDNFIPVLRPGYPVVNPHTLKEPFCADPTCPCHELNEEARAAVEKWYEDGLVTAEHAMVTLFCYPLGTLSDCAAGHHVWLRTRMVGRSVCARCSVFGYCVFCMPGDIPPGSPLRPCRFHRHSPAPLADSRLQLSALTKGRKNV